MISTWVSIKIKEKHNVTEEEVEQCIANLDQTSNKLFEDTREEHKTTPPAKWFISETDYGRKLKIVIIQQDGNVHLKTAYQANPAELALYKRLCQNK